jgi:uncharacterized protein (DUF736 family)
MSNTTENKLVEIAALWKRNSKKGKRYLAGSIDTTKLPETFGEKVKFVVFPNNNKDKDTQPDFYMYLSNLENSPQTKTTQESTASEEDDEGIL